MLVGLMGKSGSGKTLISMLLKELDDKIQIIDVDKIGHEAHNDENVKAKLKSYFGSDIFDKNGAVNRKALASIVFNDEQKMQLLYDATYDYMVRRIDSLVKTSDITVLDYALLPLTKYYAMCDLKILIEAAYDERHMRVAKRDNISKESYDVRDKNSVDYSKYSFDYIISNNQDIEHLRKAVGEVYEKSIVSR